MSMRQPSGTATLTRLNNMKNIEFGHYGDGTWHLFKIIIGEEMFVESPKSIVRITIGKYFADIFLPFHL